MERELAKEGGGFRDDVFTPTEIEYCQGKRYPAQHYAARFAAREALFKALERTPVDGLSWRDIEVVMDDDGVPSIILHGKMKALAQELGVRIIHCSLSHTATMALAYVLVEG
jgi:holo-[acyl-carrier protein] synthase